MRTRTLSVFPLLLLALTTCTELVAPHVGGAIAYVRWAGPPAEHGTLVLLERPLARPHIEVRSFNWDTVQVGLYAPSWAPDRRHLAFSATGSAGSQLFTVSLSDGKLTQVTTLPGGRYCPSWSPDGARLALVKNDQLFIANIDGTAETPVFPSTPVPRFAVVRCPRWSPDGTRILFTALADSAREGELYLVGGDGQGLVNLTNTTNDAEDDAVWSPDGRRIAFTSRPTGLPGAGTRPPGTYAMNADGTGAALLLASDQGYCASWAPDGEAIAFVSARHATTVATTDVYAMDLRDRDVERLSFEGGFAMCPSWQP